MDKISSILERYLMPFADRVSQNRYLIAIRDAFLVMLPFTMFGSLFAAIVNLPFLDYIMNEESVIYFQTIIAPTLNLTIGLMALLIVIGVAYSLGNHYKINAIYSAVTALISFLVITPTTLYIDGLEVENIIEISELGATSVFTSIVIAIIVTELYRLIIQNNWTIKMPKSVPDLVSDSFASFIPVFFILFIFFGIRFLFELTPYKYFNNFIYSTLQTPMSIISGTFLATALVGFLVHLFWFFGLHGQNIVFAAVEPIWRVLSVENLESFQNGEDLPNIITYEFVSFFVTSGHYVTYPILICILLIFKKLPEWKSLGRVSLIPGAFGIYEPLIFGMPIMLNPILFVPLVFTPVIAILIAYPAMYFNLVPRTTGVSLPFTTPAPISGAIVTYSFRGALLQLFTIAVLTGFWYIFLRISYNQKRNELLKGEDNIV